MERAFVLDYKKGKHFLDIDMSEVESVDVFTSYGDEVACFTMRDGTTIEADAGAFIGGRVENEMVERYTVARYELTEWQKRKDSSEWFTNRMLESFGIE